MLPAKPAPAPRRRSSHAASSAKPPRSPAPRARRAPPPPPSRRTSSQCPESIRAAPSRSPSHLSARHHASPPPRRRRYKNLPSGSGAARPQTRTHGRPTRHRRHRLPPEALRKLTVRNAVAHQTAFIRNIRQFLQTACDLVRLDQSLLGRRPAFFAEREEQIVRGSLQPSSHLFSHSYPCEYQPTRYSFPPFSEINVDGLHRLSYDSSSIWSATNLFLQKYAAISPAGRCAIALAAASLTSEL